MDKTYSGLIILAIFVVAVIVVVGQMSYNDLEPEEKQFDIVKFLNHSDSETSDIEEQEKNDYIIEKESSESGLSRKADGPITAEKIILLREDWNESDMRRLHLSQSRISNDDKYQPMVISEFETGKLKHVSSCHDLNSYYLLYYGQVYGNQWDYSNNKMITDYLKERMTVKDCEFKEQAELKEKIDAEKQRVDEAVEKVMKELDEVYADNG